MFLVDSRIFGIFGACDCSSGVLPDEKDSIGIKESGVLLKKIVLTSAPMPIPRRKRYAIKAVKRP